jgi:hypothetical protein
VTTAAVQEEEEEEAVQVAKKAQPLQTLHLQIVHLQTLQGLT